MPGPFCVLAAALWPVDGKMIVGIARVFYHPRPIRYALGFEGVAW